MRLAIRCVCRYLEEELPHALEVICKTEQAHYTEEDLTIPERFALLSVIAIQKNTPLMSKVP
jgi:hypothetical protein